MGEPMNNYGNDVDKINGSAGAERIGMLANDLTEKARRDPAFGFMIGVAAVALALAGAYIDNKKEVDSFFEGKVACVEEKWESLGETISSAKDFTMDHTVGLVWPDYVDKANQARKIRGSNILDPLSGDTLGTSINLAAGFSSNDAIRGNRVPLLSFNGGITFKSGGMSNYHLIEGVCGIENIENQYPRTEGERPEIIVAGNNEEPVVVAQL